MRRDLLLAYQKGLFGTQQMVDRLAALNANERYPLTEVQRGLWLLERHANAAYNVPVGFRLRGSVDVQHLRSAWAVTLLEHPSLRATVRVEGGKLFQHIGAARTLPFEQRDVSDWPDASVDAHLRAMLKRPIDLAAGPLATLHLLSKGEYDHIVLLVTHHLIFDGASVEPLLSTLLGTYQALCDGATLEKAVQAGSYRDFVEWEREYLSGARSATDREYWIRRLAAAPPRLQLPSDYGPAIQTPVEGRTYSEIVSADLAARLRATCVRLKISLSVLFLGLYKLLLHRRTGASDIVVGVSTLGRPEPRFERVVGMFANMVAVRSTIVPSSGFDAWIRQLQRAMSDDLDHAHYPFARLVRDLDLSRHGERAPLFHVAYEYESEGLSNTRRLRKAFAEKLRSEPLAGFHQEGYYELALEVVESGGTFALNVKYDGNRFLPATIERLLREFVGLAGEMSQFPERELGAVARSEPIRHGVRDGNDTQVSIDVTRPVHALFEQQVQTTPDALAVVAEGEALSYAQLNARSNRFAHYLIAQGIGRDAVVGLLFERSCDLVVAMLGTLKAGAAYLPIDTEFPDARVAYLIADARPRLIATSAALQSRCAGVAGGVPVCRVDGPGIDDAPEGDPRVGVGGGDLAYVMYTSGSTGKPKGVETSHGALLNRLLWMQSAYPIGPDDRVLQKTPYTFDVSVWEFLWPLMRGARLVLARPGGHRDAHYLRTVINEQAITVLHFVPSMLAAFLSQSADLSCPSLRHVVCSGEALPGSVVQRFYAVNASARLHNLYGPTEAAIDVTYYACERGAQRANIPIGRPIWNTQIHVLDEALEPVATGAIGELYIGGVGLARGYRHRPDLTAERFVADPFSAQEGARLYRTGDLVRRDADGVIEYLGRSDHQVKIRGVRIEIGEIEAALLDLPGVGEGAVVVRERSNGKQLVACVSPSSGRAAPEAADLRAALRNTLPEAFVPTVFETWPQLPVTANGKLDRTALTQGQGGQELAERATDAHAPTSMPGREEIEARLTRIWCEVLDVAAVDPRAGFFDIGGDSVSAVLLAEQIAAQFGREFPVTEVFRFGSIRRIVDALAAAEPVAARVDAASPVAESSPGVVASAPAADVYAGCIAIIGVACHFPGARHHEQFWDNLVNGVDSIAVATPAARAATPARPGAHHVYAWGNIEGKEFFDAEFFQVAARDAHMMDPQLRLLLQQAWAAVEDAGYVPGDIPDTGVFTTSSHNDYATLLSRGLAADSGMLTDSDQYVAWLLSQSGTIPTMISHRLGLTGPSLAVHSNCSSSLVAMHAAQRSLLAGESRQAIVGAATVSGTTLHGYVHLKGLNFSRDGRVKTFDADADGMVGSEGVAAVLLKRASDAIADGDHIYALLRGIAINNDGAQKAGFYAPSVDGQQQLIQGLLASTGVHPDSIGYVEAHGTGTELGDPIEVAALTAAWRRQTSAVQYCGIGSVKTNLGHLDTAAGLAGCIKVVLSLSRRQLPPSLHFRSANPRLNLDTSPFYVVDRHRPWPEQPQPRRAALSSLGIGGTNSHAIFEEYRPAPVAAVTAPGSYLLVLSARSVAQVDAYAGRILEFLQRAEQRGEPVDPSALTYTLQVGRQPMEHRLAVVFAGLDELRSQLDDCAAGKPSPAGCYRGTARNDSDVLRSFAADDDLQAALRNWIAKGKHHKLAELWVQGAQIDWRGLPVQRPRRMSLPTYPFKQQRFWADKATSSGASVATRETSSVPVDTLHPLLHRNTSTLSQQRFSSRFAGDEHFLRDHVVDGTPVMPGVAYLEMAHAALRESAEAPEEPMRTFRLRNVVWLRPLRIDAPTQVHITLQPLDSGDCDYEVSSTQGVRDRLVHGTGRVSVAAEHDDAVAVLDLEDLRHRADGTIEAGSLYRQFETMRIHYGPAHVVIAGLSVGTNRDAERYVLASLRLPPSVVHTATDYTLHPSLLDGALQAIIGLAIDAHASPASAPNPRPHLPFALDELDLFRAPPADAVAYCRLQASDTSGSLRKFDVDITDAQGNLCVRIRGFATRALPDAPAQERAADAAGTQFLIPAWSVRTPLLDETLTDDAGVIIVGGDAHQQQLLRARYPAARTLDVPVGHAVEAWCERLRALHAVQHVIWLPRPGAGAVAGDDALLAAQEGDVIAAFRLVKALLQLDHGSSRLRWTILTRSAQEIRRGEPVDPAQAALHGFVGSLAREYPHWPIRLADLGADTDWPVDVIAKLPADAEGEAWAYRDGEWYRRQLLPGDLSAAPADAPYRHGGVYVVIGGAGGIGEVFTRHLLTHYRANVVWIGRRDADETIEAKRRELAQLGPAPLYLCADATDAEALEQAWQQIKARYGRIDGVVHAAIVLMDKSLAGMDEDVFRAALRAKADTSVRLARLCERESLDFVAFFSSLQSFSPAAGQCNYSAGCTFADAFASVLAGRLSCPVKVMNWGYWGSVGVVASEAYRQRLAKIGLDSIEPAEGMAALDRLLGTPVRQAAFVRAAAALQARAPRTDDEIVVVGRDAPAVVRDLAVPLPAPAGGLDAMVETMVGVEELLARLIVTQLDQLGLLGATLPAAFAAMPQPLRHWLASSRRAFVERGLLRQDGDTCSVIVERDAAQVWQQWQDAKARWLQDPHVPAHVRLVDVAMTALPDMLSGKVPATDVFFPGASVEHVGALYRSNPVADYFNDVLVEALLAAIDARLRDDPSARLRLIEIGAGTGGTSASIFRRLAPYRDHIEEYCYTDVSKAFLFHAQQHYAPIAPYLQCRLFDVQRPPATQGIAGGVYDIAIAVNVLHVASDMRQAVRNVKATLRCNGVLLLNEISTWSLFAHATFGLLDGWWQFVDAPLRIDGTPGLSPGSWRQLLADEGFGEAVFPAHAHHRLGQQIVVAASDGLVRRPVAVAPVRAVEPAAAPVAAAPATAVAGRSDTLRERTMLALRKLVAETVQMSLPEIDAAEPMEKYGIDSILVVRMSAAMNAFFGDIRTTLFFEHRTIAALGDHLLANRREQTARWVGLDQSASASPAVAATPAVSARLPAAEIRRLRRSPERAESAPRAVAPVARTGSGIAVIGLSGRYAQAADVDAFWSALAQGKNCISEIPATRWDWRAYFHDERGRPGSVYTRWGGFLPEIDTFDPLFFDISPLQAEYMDPQERLFLEEAYACIEDAGYTPASLSPTRRVGVYVGAMNSTYMRVASFYSIANRVSYLFDFHGPSMAVDTACSASLTAIHLALEALHSGSCDRAIVGGVNLIVDPVHYQVLSAQTMLSSSDRCRAFGDDADGFVDGEGVGAVVLKPLDAAVADGDHIYGVIRGSCINAGGRTHGYTVPNPIAQSQLVTEALSRAGINARAVSYVEAHGTGTPLGDPIEVAALTSAFRKDTADLGFCAIGSVKSNIGHAESAAGIAGLTKVLLQMRHRQLVPSLHADVLNPQIDFGPFVVQRAPATWQRPRVAIDGAIVEFPRIAGISSFGAGGANAHVVVEEYEASADHAVATVVDEQHPVLLVLSAKTPEALSLKARRLLAAIDGGAPELRDLAAIAYTLQVGREALRYRLAFTATSLDDLRRKLAACQQDAVHAEDVHRGESASQRGVDGLFAGDEEMQEAIAKWIVRGKYAKLLALWVKGAAIDWLQLYPAGTPRRLSLPTYPFAKLRCWLERDSFLSNRSDPAPVSRRLHPLLHENTSNLDGPRFSSSFTGQEFWLADHVVHGRPVLPGMAYLEMARAAIVHGSARADAAVAGLVLRGVVWIRPLFVDRAPTRVHVALAQRDGDDMAYEVFSEADGPGGAGRVIHAQGRASWRVPEQPARVNVAALRAGGERRLDVGECYARLQASGVTHGPALRGLREAVAGTDETGARFVLARLELPESVKEGAGEYVLHPSLLDSALHAAAALESPSMQQEPLLLYAVESVTVHAAPTATAFAVLREDAGSSALLPKLRIDLCDEYGNVCVRVSGLSARRLAMPHDTAPQRTDYLSRRWMPALAAADRSTFSQRWIFGAFAEAAQVVVWREVESRLNALPQTHVERLTSQAEAEHDRYEQLGWQLIEGLRRILAGKPHGPVLVQVVTSDARRDALLQGLGAVLKTAQMENPLIRGQLISVQGDAGADAWFEQLQHDAGAPDAEIRYRDGVRQISVIGEDAAPPEQMPWKSGGVYLVTGGAGGLGLTFAEEIVERVADARVILVGRSPLSVDKAQRLRAWTDAGRGVEYRQVDCADAAAVTALIADIHAAQGRLDGVIHAAGALRDSFLRVKTRQEYDVVLGAKVRAAVNLDAAIGSRALDFFVLFSSITGTTGNIGQADYAAANGFLDAYAQYRRDRVARGERHGRTLSIAWPLWADGGMRVSESGLAQLRAEGYQALENADGVAAFYRACGSEASCVLVVRRDAVLDTRAARTAAGPVVPDTPVVAPRRGDTSARSYLQRSLETLLKLPAAQLEPGAPFSRYGMDSIIALRLTHELEKRFGPLPKTLFFEYPNFDALYGYFEDAHGDALRRIVGPEPQAAAVSKPAPRAAAVAQLPAVRAAAHLTQTAPTSASVGVSQPDSAIAIIGLSGRYPQARTVDALWDKLRAGEDCVTPIPAERWDAERDFDERKGEPGKSYGKWGGFLPGVDEFDPVFFGLSPREAEYTDPQQRLFLETVWNLLESSGYTRERIEREHAGKVGLYVGSMYSEYDGLQERLLSRFIVQSMQSGIANRVSHYFGLTGASVAIDTMCSSSIVALHLACADLRRGDCALAIAGGVNLTVDARKFVSLSQAQLLSSRHEARSFGDSDGYLPAEAIGAVLLKPLTQAVADGDEIWAVVKATATNHGGAGQPFQVPNVQGQVQVMREVLRRADVAGETISYVEAAASGGLGDAMEVASLRQVLGRADAGPCALGSVKSNLGHAEAASGITQLTKVLLQLRHGVLVPTIRSEPMNPNVELGTSLQLQRELGEWARPVVNGVEQPRRALINAFGAGGANASAIVEEYRSARPAAVPEASPAQAQVLVFSGRTAAGLHAVVGQLAAWLAQQASVDLADLSYTLQQCREAMEHRLALVVHERAELATALQDYLDGAPRAAGPALHAGDLDSAAQWRRVASGEMVQQLLQQAVAQRDLEQIAQLWVQHIAVDWSALRDATVRPVRLRLPTYPFARERYWVPQDVVVAHDETTADGDVDAFIADFLRRTLGLAPAQWSVQAPLQRYGVDSLIGLRLVHALNARFGVELGGRDLLTVRSAYGLSERVRAEQRAMPARAVTASVTQAVPAPLAPTATRVPLSEGQKGLWAHHSLLPESDVYNLPLAIRCERALDARALEGAWRQVVEQLPLLYSRVELDGSEPYLQPLPLRGPLVAAIDASGWSEAQVQARLRALAKTPLVLAQGPLLQIHWLRGAACGDVLLVVVHHLMFDGTSMPPLLDAFVEAYVAQLHGTAPALPATTASYAEFVAQERAYLQSARALRDRAYWQTQWGEALPVLELPTDRPRQRDGRVQGQTRYGVVDEARSERVRVFCADHGVSAAALFLGVYELLLYRYSGQSDLMVGVPTQGRWDERFGEVVGYCMNLVALRSRQQPQASLLQWVNGAQDRLVDALDHAAYPFAKLVRELRAAREPGRTPVFQAAFEFQNATVLQQGRLAQRLAQVLSGEFTPWVNQEGEYEIVLEVVETGTVHGLRLKYDGSLFDAATMDGFLAHYADLLDDLLQTPQRRVSECRRLGEAERERVLVTWNATQRAVAPGTVPQRMAEQAKQRPQAIALICAGESLSYAELDRRSEAVANYLASEGIVRGSLVGVCLDRSADLVIALLGVLKAGAAYVPLAPDYPAARLDYMIASSGLACVLTQQRWQALLEPLCGAVPLVLVDEQRERIAASAPRTTPAAGPQDLAYVIYTSGSTGQPKGVMIEHGALSNFLDSLRETPGLQAQDRLLALTTYSFDIAGLELYLPLLVGATCIVASAEEARDAQRLEAAIAAHRPTVMQATPATWQLLLQHGWRNAEGLTIFCGGEALSEQLKESLRATGAAMWNLFGPTETTIWSTVERLGEAAVTIGRPIANTQLYILDDDLEPVGTGERGELYIGGDGLARGYLNRPGLTAERFIANPFASDGGRLYRTGDIARYLADGRVQYLGRGDSQVKIRGFRIELGEIEAALRGCDGVLQAAATTFVDDAGERYIAAYAVAATGATLATDTLRAVLLRALPDYMLPSAFVLLEALPLTPNNKVDYKSLPKPDFNQPSNAYVAPRTLDEQWLAKLWQEALHVERVGLADNFLALGGHSLSAMKVVAKVRQRLGFDVRLHSLFEAPTLATWWEMLCSQRDGHDVEPAQDGQISALLEKVGAMSDEEVARALNQLRNSLHEAQ